MRNSTAPAIPNSWTAPRVTELTLDCSSSVTNRGQSRQKFVCGGCRRVIGELTPLSWFVRKCLPQGRQRVERSLRQRAFLDRGEGVVELLRRRNPDQDRAHRRVRQRKPCGGFGQAAGKTGFGRQPEIVDHDRDIVVGI